MRLKLLADENIDFRLVTELKKQAFEVISVLKEYPGISDEQVLMLAKRHEAILITEDSDFGKWIFAYKETGVSVVFLRYKTEQLHEITTTLIKVLKEHGASLYGKFVVITPQKIRIRDI